MVRDLNRKVVVIDRHVLRAMTLMPDSGNLCGENRGQRPRSAQVQVSTTVSAVAILTSIQSAAELRHVVPRGTRIPCTRAQNHAESNGK